MKVTGRTRFKAWEPPDSVSVKSGPEQDACTYVVGMCAKGGDVLVENSLSGQLAGRPRAVDGLTQGRCQWSAVMDRQRIGPGLNKCISVKLQTVSAGVRGGTNTAGVPQRP
jgi:hypothetical protein